LITQFRNLTSQTQAVFQQNINLKHRLTVSSNWQWKSALSRIQTADSWLLEFPRRKYQIGGAYRTQSNPSLFEP